MIFGHRQIFYLIFKNENSSTDACIWKPLEMVAGSDDFQNAGSGVFQNSAVNDNNWNKFLIQIDHKLSSENSSRLPPKGKYWRKRFLVLGKELPTIKLRYAGRLCISSRTFWLIYQTNALGITWTCKNVFAAVWRSCLRLSSWWNISGVLCSLLARPPWFHKTTVMQILRMLLERPHKYQLLEG